jgi:hypothetical protein
MQHQRIVRSGRDRTATRQSLGSAWVEYAAFSSCFCGYEQRQKARRGEHAAGRASPRADCAPALVHYSGGKLAPRTVAQFAVSATRTMANVALSTL